MLLFDTKIAQAHTRYLNAAWAWTLEFYLGCMAPLRFVGSHNIGSREEDGLTIDSEILVFRRT